MTDINRHKLVLNSFAVLLKRDLAVAEIRWGTTPAANIFNDITASITLGAFDKIATIQDARDSTELASAAQRMGAQIRALAHNSDLLLTGVREFPTRGVALRRSLIEPDITLMMVEGANVEFSIPVMAMRVA